MAEQKWNEVGSSISEAVQEAINSQDFSKLSQRIQSTVADAAMDSVAQGMNMVGNTLNQAADVLTGRRDYRPDYMKRRTEVPHGQYLRKSVAGMDAKNRTQWRAADLPNTELYSSGGSTRAGGYALAILGGIGCFAFGVAEIVLGVTALAIGGLWGIGIPIAIMVLFLAGSIFVNRRGVKTLRRIKMFKNYVRLLGDRQMISITELAQGTGRSEAETKKSVKEMLSYGMFRQGRLDTSEKTLFTSREGYEAYERSREIAEMQRQQRLEDQMQQAAQMGKTEKHKELPQEVRRLIADGEAYVAQIRAYNDAIAGEEVTRKLDGLEAVTRKIFEYVSDHPESADETKKLMRYYLPTTIRLLDSYQKLDDNPVQGENIEKSRREIEHTLDTLNQAFARLFDNLYQDTSLDIASDISVLNTLLAQEGLTGENIMK
ncbi:MAG: 5-bromo-4-chloroindolyl phosphate hydrolysis family protein [Eubacteriales bacterium]|nr:5-bromo-4-chloroindolyl phosphate hydrolysis family protein [Eubacteriales bacterium]